MAGFLREAGYEAIDVRDTGLRGAKDKEILEFANQHGATVITADVGFSGLFFLSSIQHNGLVVLRVPNSFSIDQTIKRPALVAVESLADQLGSVYRFQ